MIARFFFIFGIKKKKKEDTVNRVYFTLGPVLTAGLVLKTRIPSTQ